ncbi:kinase-like protein, partial [Clavulina sp. PMI_390]
REAIIHSQLRHPNILPLLGVYHDKVDLHPLTILPFHERSSLEKLLDELKPRLMDQPNLIRILVGSARGVVYLHSRTPSIIHGDLHPGNILIDNDGSPVLCDFGLSRIKHEVSRPLSIREGGGKARFVAPELYESSADLFASSQESDVFGLAMTFLNAWSGQLPFFEIKNERQVTSKLRQGLRPMEPVAAVTLDSSLKIGFWQLLEGMWAHNVSKRPSSNKVLDQLESIFDHGEFLESGLQSIPCVSDY